MLDRKSKKTDGTVTVGVISDTHGFLHPAVARAFNGVNHIIHAGDIVSQEIFSELSNMAPTTAVLGNMDSEGRFDTLSDTAVVEIGGVLIYVLHDLDKIDLNPEGAGFSGVVYGHTHQSDVQSKGSVLYVNPGSAGEPRSDRPSSIALLTIKNKNLTARIVRLPQL
jgi:hypothetical protein